MLLFFMLDRLKVNEQLGSAYLCHMSHYTNTSDFHNDQDPDVLDRMILPYNLKSILIFC